MKQRYWMAFSGALGWFVFMQFDAGYSGGIGSDIKALAELTLGAMIYALLGFGCGRFIERLAIRAK